MINDRIIFYYINFGKPIFTNVENFEYTILPRTSLQNAVLKLEDFDKWEGVLTFVPNYTIEIVYDFESPYLQFLGFTPSDYYFKNYVFDNIAEKFVGVQRTKENFIKFQYELIDNNFDNQSMIDNKFISEIDKLYITKRC